MGGILNLEDSNSHVVSITPKDGATGDRVVTIPDSVADLDTANTFGGNIEAPSMTIGGKDVYNEANILGTVSQTAGVPTGAIIERGSNANGWFVKFADGTLIQQGEANSSSGGSINTLPTSFIDAFFSLTANHRGNFTGSDTNVVIGNYTTATFVAFSSFTASIAIRWIAVGRWY